MAAHLVPQHKKRAKDRRDTRESSKLGQLRRLSDDTKGCVIRDQVSHRPARAAQVSEGNDNGHLQLAGSSRGYLGRLADGQTGKLANPEGNEGPDG